MPWLDPGVHLSALSYPWSSLITVMELLIPGREQTPLTTPEGERGLDPRSLVPSWEHFVCQSPFSSSCFCTFFSWKNNVQRTLYKGISPQWTLPSGNQEVLISYRDLTLLPKHFTKSHPYALTLWDLGLQINLSNACHKVIPCCTNPFYRARSCCILKTLEGSWDSHSQEHSQVP